MPIKLTSANQDQELPDLLHLYGGLRFPTEKIHITVSLQPWFGPWREKHENHNYRKVGLLSTRTTVSCCLRVCHISSCNLNIRASNNIRSCTKDSLHSIPNIFILHCKLARCIVNCSCFLAIHTFPKNGTAYVIM